MKTSVRFVAVALLTGLTALGTLQPAHAQDLAGQGEWQSLSGEAIKGTWTADIRRSGSQLTGTMALRGSNALSGGTVTGNIDADNISVGIVLAGGTIASFSGRLAGESISGEWQSPVLQDEGVWFGTLRAR